MNIIGCLDTPTTGSYWLAGEEVSGLTDDDLAEIRSEQIGFVFQNFNLLPRTTALFNVELPLYYHSRHLHDRHERAAKRMAEVGLLDRLDDQSSAFSGGQQQRIAIARALVNDPILVLADEPTGALDTKTGAEIMQILRRLNDQGTTIVMVTHEPEIAGYAERLVRFRDGLLVSDEPVTRAEAD
jgi:putative ABC transport system ATP-binding protein